MIQAIASMIRTGAEFQLIFNWFLALFVCAAGAVALVSRCGRFFVQWWNGILGRAWLTVSATVDVASVAPEMMQTKAGEITVGYLATLTYFYRNPELQMGGYCHSFGAGDEAGAQAWAASYKGRSVVVHVDPRDPSRSVLRKEDLQQVATGLPSHPFADP